MQAVRTTLAVLEAVVTSQPIGVSELARQLDIPKSTAQRSLLALESEGWLQRSPEQGGAWMQTSKLWILGSRGNGSGLRAKALEVMNGLLAEVNENVHLTTREGDTIVIVEKLESSHPVRVFDPMGTAVPMHASASGKAIMAWAEPDDLEAYLARHRDEFTDETITDADALRAELAQIHEQGYAINRGEWRSEIRGVGVPVFEPGLSPRFGLTVSAPSHRLADADIPALATLVIDAGRRLSESL